MTCFDESISVRGRCSRSLRAVFLLGFLLYGLTVTAQETGRDVSAGTSESLRQKTSSLSEGKQDTVIFRFAPQRRMFWADYKGNAAAIKSLTRSIRHRQIPRQTGHTADESRQHSRESAYQESRPFDDTGAGRLRGVLPVGLQRLHEQTQRRPNGHVVRLFHETAFG